MRARCIASALWIPAGCMVLRPSRALNRGMTTALVRRTAPRRFRLIRQADPSGVSGTGPVVEGVEWSDGTVALHWCGSVPATSVWHDGIAAVIAVHGHDGATVVDWIDQSPRSGEAGA